MPHPHLLGSRRTNPTLFLDTVLPLFPTFLQSPGRSSRRPSSPHPNRALVRSKPCRRLEDTLRAPICSSPPHHSVLKSYKGFLCWTLHRPLPLPFSRRARPACNCCTPCAPSSLLVLPLSALPFSRYLVLSPSRHLSPLSIRSRRSVNPQSPRSRSPSQCIFSRAVILRRSVVRQALRSWFLVIVF